MEKQSGTATVTPVSWRLAWNTAAAALVEPRGRDAFAAGLYGALKQVAGFSHAVTFGYPPGQRPVLLHHEFSAAERAASLSAYIRGTFLLDPFYDACLRGIDEGVYRMEDVAPDDFYASIGLHPGYVSPCVSSEPGVLSEEIGFFGRTGQGTYFVLSLMRDQNEPPFSESEMDRLREIAPLVCAMMRSHFPASGVSAQDEARQSALTSGVGDLAGLVSACSRGRVTAREAEVAVLMLKGHSSESVAHVLGISVSTVKVHRRNLYDKFEVSSQAAFFALVLSAIVGTGRSAGPGGS